MRIQAMFKLVVLIFLMTISTIPSISQEKLDVIILKTGGKVIGRIIEKIEGQSILCQLQSGNTIRILWNDIKETSEVYFKTLTSMMKATVPVENSIAKDSIWFVKMYNSTQHSDITLDSLKGSELYVTKAQVRGIINIDSIHEIGTNKNTKILNIIGIGASVGVIYAAATYQEPSSQKTDDLLWGVFGGGILSAIPRVLVGAFVGALIVIPIGLFFYDSDNSIANFTGNGNNHVTIEHLMKIFNTHRK
jgi:hypothetical protein